MDFVQHLNETKFAHVIKSEQRPVLVDFVASWCGSCKAMSPALDSYAKAHPEVKVVELDIDEAQDTALTYKVRAVPTIMVFRDGLPIISRTGTLSASQLDKFLHSYTH